MPVLAQCNRCLRPAVASADDHNVCVKIRYLVQCKVHLEYEVVRFQTAIET